jgi:hypothetical protein
MRPRRGIEQVEVLQPRLQAEVVRMAHQLEPARDFAQRLRAVVDGQLGDELVHLPDVRQGMLGLAAAEPVDHVLFRLPGTGA